MISTFPQPTPASTTSYTGIPAPYPTDAGTEQTGGWAAIPAPNGQQVLEGVQAASYVTVLGQDSRLKVVGTKQQLSLVLSLSGDAGGYTLTPGLTDAKGNTGVAVGSYFYAVSRQKFVATITGGVITPVGIGQTEVGVRWPVAQVNLSFAGATSNPTNFLEARINLTVTA